LIPKFKLKKDSNVKVLRSLMACNVLLVSVVKQNYRLQNYIMT